MSGEDDARPSGSLGRNPAGIAFVIIALLVIGCLWADLGIERCQSGDDAAGCGMSKGFAALAAYALMALVGMAGLVFLIGRPLARGLAWLVVGGIGVVAAGSLASTIATNLQATSTVDGIDPHRPEAAPDFGARRAMRCFLAARLRLADDREAAASFDDMGAYFAGELAQWRGNLEYPALLKLAKEEGRTLTTEDARADAIATCADLQVGDSDFHRDLLEAAGHDASEVEIRRERARRVAPAAASSPR